jgi:hypothetical protein
MKALLGGLTHRRSTGLIVAATAFLSTAAFAAPAPVSHDILVHRTYRSTPPDSFLVYKVYSIDQLIAEVQSSPRIQGYYARHFHVPQSRVIEYMQANLVESYIPETRMYTCYCVRANGLIYPIKQRFTQGTKVFALRNGEPVLKWVCGNPLSKFLPAVETHTIVKNIPVIKLAPSTEVIAPTDNVQILVPTETQTVVTNASSDVDALVPEPILGAASPSNFVFAPGGGGGGGLGFLGLLPVIFAATHTSGGGSGSGPHGGPLPVPEASTMESSAIMLSIGALFLGLRRRTASRAQ